jgi:hypothetical protein
LFPDGLFADLFRSMTGRPSVPADVVASVIVLQSLHGLSDREAVEALRCDLRWKAACGLALTDEGFHPMTLTYWRRRLAASKAPDRVFDAVKRVVAQTGVLPGKTRRALDLITARWSLFPSAHDPGRAVVPSPGYPSGYGATGVFAG